MTTIPTRFRIRRDTAATWAAVNPVLLNAEPALETDTGLVKYGDGVTPWNSLPYAGVIWGAIEGDITDQADLQAALDALQDAINGKHGAVAGAVSGTFASPTSITVENGIVTAIS